MERNYFINKNNNLGRKQTK